MKVLTILHLMFKESGFYEERLKRRKQSNPYLTGISKIKIKTQDFPSILLNLLVC
jgi:hypothetical protein